MDVYKKDECFASLAKEGSQSRNTSIIKPAASLKAHLNELKINVANKSYSRDNRLNKLEKLRFSECFGTWMSAYLNQNL